MYLCFYTLSILTILFTILSIIQTKIMYALFYFFISVLTTSGIFFVLGDYMIGSLQMIIYSGAILILFVFVVMLLNFNDMKNNCCSRKYNYFYFFLLISFFYTFFYKIFFCIHRKYIFQVINHLNVLGKILFDPYILLIEFTSILLLSIVIIVFLISKKNK
ncbi:NADH-quinone oxidoreductase subunit J [Buchnera aphidicola]|uniref:NADH-quinone oxidoreductase subunit J n=1 Tax=Buchnera aphidicola (Sarucallis kahawaluokalani) TaxID=1241878 RepID=A0A4D6Y8D8_9GAMM|nr:NADH-quinone oxidoreductase subunit J [Buchnera aphidicola]QCI25917.1 NADH-quinone oxidoreductase subunit J [Buchnera aphidicola (Sarucallis kahawaluokalani)]